MAGGARDFREARHRHYYPPAMLLLAVAQFKPGKGNYAEKLARIGGIFAELADRADPPELLVFPEAALTGYLLEGGVRDLAVTAGTLFEDLQAQHQRAAGPPLDVCMGF